MGSDTRLHIYWRIKSSWGLKADQMLAGLLKQSKSGFLVRVDYKEGLEYSDEAFARGKQVISDFLRDLHNELAPPARSLLFGKE